LKEEMQVGLNAYSLYKGFNDVQSVTLEKAQVNMSLLCSRSKNIDG
jgi:molybdopterin-containing oxidoreductase family iron-sulfur binding subunit